MKEQEFFCMSVQRGWVDMIQSVSTHTRGMGLLKSDDFELTYFLNSHLTKLYNSDHGLLNRDNLACSRKQSKTNKPVQANHLSLRIRFLFDSSRALYIILIMRNSRFFLYI